MSSPFKVGDKLKYLPYEGMGIYVVYRVVGEDVYLIRPGGTRADFPCDKKYFKLIEEETKPEVTNNPFIYHIPAKVSIKPTTFQLGPIKFRNAQVDTGEDGVYLLNDHIKSNSGRYSIADLKCFAQDINLLIEALEILKCSGR